ncbi:MAG: DUF3971 domain-containing protein, partial [Gammaproteobacteria bacterium]
MSLPTMDLGATPGAFSVAWDTRDGAPVAFAARAAELPLAALAALAGGLPGLPARLRATLAAVQPQGRLAHGELAWRPAAGDAPRWYAGLHVSDLRSREDTSLPALDALDFELRANAAGGFVALADSAVDLSHERLVAPLAVSGLDGVLHWQRDAAGRLALSSQRLAATVNDIELVAAFALADAGGARELDLRVDMPAGSGARLQELLPDNVLPARGERWVRAIIEAGRVGNGHLLVRGPLAAWPFDDADGVLALDFDVADGHLVYSERWPPAREVAGHVSLRGREVTMSVDHARVLGATVDRATITMPDLFVRERRVTLSGRAHGPAQSATDIVMASPLRNGKAARLADVDIGGELEVTLDMNIALFRGGPREVLGTARFDGNRVRAPRQNIVLEDVSGAVSFTRGDWYGEGLTATYDGARVGLVVAGGLADPNYDSEFRMTGTSPAGQLVKYLARYAPPVYRWLEHNEGIDALTGELPWKAVLTIPVARADGPPLPRRLRLESNLRGLDVDLPWPFGKRSGERKPLTIEVALDGGVAELTRVDFGDTLDAEIAAER